MHSELKIAQLFVLLVRPKLVIKFIERETLFFNPQDQIRVRVRVRVRVTG